MGPIVQRRSAKSTICLPVPLAVVPLAVLVCRLKRDEPDLLNDPEDRRLWRRLQQLKALPERDKRAILRMLDTMAGAADNEM